MTGGKKGEKALNLGGRLKYPIKITKLYKNPGDTIRRQDPILQYSFEYTMELPNDRATLEFQTKTLTSITDWNAPEDGKLVSWQVRVGDTITRDQACATVEEACTHEVQFQGLCALCGKDMNEVNWASEHRDTERAPINMTHDQTNLTVSRVAATRAEHELQNRLLTQRKLSLVVDLDQTIIHACIDPTIGEWQEDKTNPNYDALKDVRRFQLDEGYHGLARGCWYYIKMRPGLSQFLEKISNLYELHVYTMGTRTYATNIAQIVDPEQKLFGNRVISRDENGNIVAKSLQRLFPVSTNMAVIMDDRADVWPYNRQNLIKVTPYDFFKGTGDINSSFLPKRNDISTASSDPVPATTSDAASAAAASIASEASDTPPDPVAADSNHAAVSPASSEATTATTTTATASPPTSPATTTEPINAPEKVVPVVAPTNGTTKVVDLDDSVDDPVLLQKQAEEQERTIEKQIKDRPLQHMQEQLDKEDQEAAAAAGSEPEAAEQNETDDKHQSRTRHCVLFDDDTELRYLETHLTKLHDEFYKQYDAKRGPASEDEEPDGTDGAVPDVGEVLDEMKNRVLHNTTIVLSGLVPLGLDVERSEIGLQALSFGARLQKHINGRVTHLVISSDRPRTQKVRQAARIPSIKIVNQRWLADCFSQWTRLDETPYLIDIHPSDRERSMTTGTQSEATDSETISDEDNDQAAASKRVKIVLSTPSGGYAAAREDDGEDDEFTDFNNSDAVSPIAELGTFDWGSADDELEMFLAEDGDDDDDEDENFGMDYGGGEDNGAAKEDDGGNGDRLNDGGSSSSKRKVNDEVDTDGEQSSSRGRTLFAKRQKLGESRSRSSSKRRKALSSVPNDSTTHPLRMSQETSSQGNAVPVKATAQPASVDIDEDQLEAMLMAELDEEEAAGENG